LEAYARHVLGLVLLRFCECGSSFRTGRALTDCEQVTYPFGIFSSTIISQLNPNDSVVQNIGYGTVVNLFYLPGCIAGGFLMDWVGRKQTMTLGFFCWSILGFIIGGALGKIQNILPL